MDNALRLVLWLTGCFAGQHFGGNTLRGKTGVEAASGCQEGQAHHLLWA